MKSILLLAAIAAFYGAGAQDDSYKDLMKKHRKPGITTPGLPEFKGIDIKRMPLASRTLLSGQALAAFPDAKHVTVLPNNSSVFALPQDHMPCVVPDRKQFSMPNAATQVYPYVYNGPGAIPNPARSRGGQQSPPSRVRAVLK